MTRENTGKGGGDRALEAVNEEVASRCLPPMLELRGESVCFHPGWLGLLVPQEDPRTRVHTAFVCLKLVFSTEL